MNRLNVPLYTFGPRRTAGSRSTLSTRGGGVAADIRTIGHKTMRTRSYQSAIVYRKVVWKHVYAERSYCAEKGNPHV